MDKPQLIEFSKVGSTNLGYLSVAENSALPFKIERVYWTYYTPDSIVRGHHAHKELQQLIFAVSGSIDFTLEDLNGQRVYFQLNQPNIGLYVPKLYWREIKLSHNAVLLCLASMEYEEDDYIRSYYDFHNLNRNSL